MKGVLLLCWGLALVLAHTAEASTGGRRLVEEERGFSRTDPLDGFRKYREGYNISNIHYWSSAVFTGVNVYAMAVLWLLVGLVYAAVLLCCGATADNGKEPPTESKPKSRLWILMPTVLVLLVIASAGVAMAGTVGFHSRVGAIKGKIEETAELASSTIYNLTTSVKAIREETELSAKFVEASERLISDSSAMQRKAERIIRLISRGLRILHGTTIAVASLTLVLALGLLGLGLLKLRLPFILLLAFTWVMISLCWANSGLYFFVDRFAGDTCTALDEYQQNPGNSSLASFLPCDGELPARRALQDTRSEISSLINQVNEEIAKRRSSSSFPGLPSVCNPFSGPPDFRFQPENCSSGLQIGDIPGILESYVCSGGESGSSCGQGEFIPANDYRSVVIYATSLQTILNSFQAVEKLANCGTIKDAVSEILNNECRPMKRSARTSWSAIAALSAATSLLVLSSAALFDCDRRRRAPLVDRA